MLTFREVLAPRHVVITGSVSRSQFASISTSIKYVARDRSADCQFDRVGLLRENHCRKLPIKIINNKSGN